MVEIIMLHFTSVMFKFVLEESSTPIIGRHRSTAYVDAIVTDRVAWSVCLYVLSTLAGPRNHVLDGGPDPPWEGAILRLKGATRFKV